MTARYAAVALGAALLGACSQGAADNVLTTQGLGKVKVGMTLEAAETALGSKLEIGYPNDKSCGTGGRADKMDDNVWYMFENGNVARIDVGNEGAHVARIVTAEGVGAGSTEKAVLDVYRGRVKVQPHPYLENQGHYLVVDDPDHKHGIIFETDLEVVTSVRAGAYPALGYIEGCV